MAYEQDSGRDFRPFRSGDFNHRTPIALGGQTASPYRRGVSDLAYNQLTLWAQIGNPLILHAPHPGNSTVTLTAANTDYDIAAYYFYIPNFVNASAVSGRRYVTARVRGYVSAGTWTPKARTSSGPGTGASGNTVSSIIDIDVPIQEGPVEDYFILTVRGNTAGATFTLESLTVTLKPITTTSLSSGSSIYNQDAFHPVDSTVQVGEDMPLTVDTVKSLALSNNAMFEHNLRQVVNFCGIHNFGTLWAAQTTATSGRYIGLAETDVNGYRPAWQWLYFPRQGPIKLRVKVDGYVPGWVNSTDNVVVDFTVRNMDGEPVGTSASAAITGLNYFADATWTGGDITDIKGPGPYYIDMRARIFSATGNTARILAVSIYEVYEGLI